MEPDPELLGVEGGAAWGAGLAGGVGATYGAAVVVGGGGSLLVVGAGGT